MPSTPLTCAPPPCSLWPASRLSCAVEAALDVALPLLALYQLAPEAAPGASALRAVAALAAGNGVAALVLTTLASPLPPRRVGNTVGVGGGAWAAQPQPARAPTRPPPTTPPHLRRWRLGVVAAVGAALLARTHALCGSALLRHGWATMHTLACILLPLIAPAFINWMPAGGVTALAARVPVAQTAAEEAAAHAQCAASQAASVLAGCAALAVHLYRADQRRRKLQASPSTDAVPSAGAAARR